MMLDCAHENAWFLYLVLFAVVMAIKAERRT